MAREPRVHLHVGPSDTGDLANPANSREARSRQSVRGIGAGLMLTWMAAQALAGRATTPPSEPENSTERRNAAIGRQVLVEVWGKGRLELVDDLLAPTYIDHTPRGPEPSTVQGPEGLKQAVTIFRTAFPDLTYSVDVQIARDDLVATRFTAAGTHTGVFQGIQPTGRRVTYTGIDMNRIVDGQIVEAWVSYDALGLLQQIGAIPGQEQPVSDETS